jgi:UDP:flavonoid glycosyltransferase YjiC (YdhE family)
MTINSTHQAADGIAAMAVNGSAKKPRLLFCGVPADGHIRPVLRVAKELKQRGYPMAFVTGDEYREPVEALGSELFVIPPAVTPSFFEEQAAFEPGLEQLAHGLKFIFVGGIAARWNVLKKALETLRERNPDETIVIVTEIFFMGHMPLVYGAPLPKGFSERPKVIGLGVSAYLAYSVDVGPSIGGLPPDSTPSGRARNVLLNMLMETGVFAEARAEETAIMKELGAVDFKSDNLISKWYHQTDVTLQMNPPSVEYPRSDLPATVKYIGALPVKPMEPSFVYPSWWDEIKKGDKKVLMVTQGTIELNYNSLIVPTIRAFANRDDIIVVAILGIKGSTLPDDVEIPANTRVIDYLNYDALLPHTDVFVTNGGYGGFLHGLINGVPMVLAGEGQDKPEVAMRAEWSGVGVNLRTATPTVDQVREGVDKILSDGSYKEKTEAVKKENMTLQTLDRIEEYIIKYQG